MVFSLHQLRRQPQEASGRVGHSILVAPYLLGPIGSVKEFT
jgi:hypothetical protein